MIHEVDTAEYSNDPYDIDLWRIDLEMVHYTLFTHGLY